MNHLAKVQIMHLCCVRPDYCRCLTSVFLEEQGVRQVISLKPAEQFIQSIMSRS